MIQASVYKISSISFIKAFAMILETALIRNLKVFIACPSRELMHNLDSELWTYSPTSFLPHATIEDDLCESQKILLSNDINDNKNNAELLISNHVIPNNIMKYQRFISIYDIHENDQFLERIRILKEFDISIQIFEERNGIWEKSNYPIKK